MARGRADTRGGGGTTNGHDDEIMIQRTFRVSRDTWEEARKLYGARGITVSEGIRRSLERAIAREAREAKSKR